jgi:hypothetical protein
MKTKVPSLASWLRARGWTHNWALGRTLAEDIYERKVLGKVKRAR